LSIDTGLKILLIITGGVKKYRKNSTCKESKAELIKKEAIR
jgi:hypothetical protein